MDPKEENKNKLDPQVDAKIKELIEKTPEELTEADAAFLRARVSYLGKASRQKFASVLKGKAAEPEVVKEKEENPLEHPAVVDAKKTDEAEEPDEVDEDTEDDEVEKG